MRPKWVWPAALVVACFSGCGVVPTAPHGEGVIAPQTIRTIKTGETREDILLSLGDPASRFSDDHYFIYDWTQTVGYWFAFSPTGSGGATPIKSRHYLAIEFDSDNRVRRLLDLSHWGSQKSELELALEKWMEEGAERSSGSKP